MNKQQLANRIWASANKMRSKIDANEYKDYILGLIFYKFLSDHEAAFLRHDGWTDDNMRQYLVEDYTNTVARQSIEYCRNNIGYFIEYRHLFSTWLHDDADFSVADLSRALSAFDRLVSDNYRPVYDGIFRTLQAGLSKLGENPASQTRALKDLIRLIKDIPTDGAQDYDVLGYVYEYLIGNFAANAGKKAGEFYTPHEVAILMSEIVAWHHRDKQQLEIYDPTSGSGSLLITIGKSIGRHIEDRNRVKYYAQELKENTYNLTRMNLVMRGITPGNISTRCADSLADDWPVHTDGLDVGRPLYVDAVVSNPPYSQHWDPTDRALDPRFKDYGVAPKSKADYAFLLHELHHLRPDGILTIVLPHGVLFRGGEEEQIRRALIEHNNIDAVIGLPPNIFFGTGIPTLVMVLRQHRDADDVLIVDASKGFVKDGKQNRLRACDIRRIADTYRERRDVPGFSRNVSRDEIRRKGYNLNIPRYVDSAPPAEPYDIYATIFGGIPNDEIDALGRYWQAFPSLRSALFAPAADGSPYSSLRTDDLRAAIAAADDVSALRSRFAEAFRSFPDVMHAVLIDNLRQFRELRAQDDIARDVFRRLEAIPLADPYAAYQALADRWPAIVGDIETLRETFDASGFDAAREVETAYRVVRKGDDDIEVPDGIKGRLIPFSLIQEEQFAPELRAIADLEARLEQIPAEADEVLEQFTPEEVDAYYEDDVLNKARVKADAKPRSKTAVDPETKERLRRLVALWDEQTSTAKRLRAERQTLTDRTAEALSALTDADVCRLLHRKWIDPVVAGIAATLTAALSDLETSVTALSRKYDVSLRSLDAALAAASSRLSGLIADLDGDAYALRGLTTLGA